MSIPPHWHKRQHILEQRLANVENSSMFRAARWAGAKAAGLRARWLGPPPPHPVNAFRYRELVALENTLLGGPLPPLFRNPRISVVIDSRNTPPDWVAEAVASVRAQTYGNWELCVDGAEPAGEYVMRMGAGATLPRYSLYFFAAALQRGDADVVYSDEDTLDSRGERRDPLFKPGWSPELEESAGYIGDAAIRRATAGVGRVVHVPRVLYHTREPRRPQPVSTPPKAPTPKVSLVICSRDRKLITSCLRSLAKTDYPDFETIVVLHHLRTDLPGAHAIHYDGPFHWSRMNNHGVSNASGEVIVLMNDDVTVLEPGWLTRLVANVMRPGVGAAGAKLLYPNGAIQHAGVALGMMEGAGHPGHGQFRSPWPLADFTRNVSAVTGACMAFRRAVFEEAGGLAEEFPVNYNDVDFCLRLSGMGYRIVYEPRAVLRHHESQTRARGTHWRERELFWSRWESRLSRPDPFYPVYFRDDAEPVELRPVLELEEMLRPKPSEAPVGHAAR